MKMYEVTLIVLIDTSGYELFKPCIFTSEQWFIQARCYATKREKPLSIPDKRRVSGQWPNKWHISIKLNIAKKNLAPGLGAPHMVYMTHCLKELTRTLPLWATVPFPINYEHAHDTYVKKSNDITFSCFARNTRGLLDPMTWQQWECKKKTIGLIRKATTLQLCTHITLFCYFFCHFCATTMWECPVSHFMENLNKQHQNLISLCEPGYGS